MKIVVTDVTFDHDIDRWGPTVTVSVSRIPEQVMFDGLPPAAVDIPADLRKGLLEWLSS